MSGEYGNDSYDPWSKEEIEATARVRRGVLKISMWAAVISLSVSGCSAAIDFSAFARISLAFAIGWVLFAYWWWID
jgi:hypothetical protein